MKNKEMIHNESDVNIQQENINESKLSIDERESHLWYDEFDKKWYAETSVKKHISKFRKMGWTEVKKLQYKDGSDCIVTFEAPEFAISIRKPMKKIISEERRAAMSKNMKNLQNSKKL